MSKWNDNGFDLKHSWLVRSLADTFIIATTIIIIIIITAVVRQQVRVKIKPKTESKPGTIWSNVRCTTNAPTFLLEWTPAKRINLLAHPHAVTWGFVLYQMHRNFNIFFCITLCTKEHRYTRLAVVNISVRKSCLVICTKQENSRLKVRDTTLDPRTPVENRWHARKAKTTKYLLDFDVPASIVISYSSAFFTYFCLLVFCYQRLVN